jgi:hypothetical protein
MVVRIVVTRSQLVVHVLIIAFVRHLLLFLEHTHGHMHAEMLAAI